VKKLIVHIGTSKAGSSTIQRFLTVNQKSLADNCALWIADGEMNLGNDKQGFPIGYFEKLFQQVEPTKRPYALAETWQQFARIMERFGKTTAVVSAECISNRAEYAEFFRSATTHFQINVIAYIRRQDEWIASAWKQWPMKSGISLEDYARQCMAAKSPRFLDVFESWKRIADPENIRIKPLSDRFLHPQGLAKDFAETAGIQHGSLDYEMPVVNSTFDYSILSILQSKPAVFRNVHDNALFDYLGKFPELTKQCGKSASLSSSLQALVMDSFEEENREMHRKYFPHLEYDDVFGLRPETEQEPPSLIQTLSEVTAIQFKMLQVLDQEVEKLKQRNSPTPWLMSLRNLLRRWKRSAQKRIY
jgi:hypothetical protein